MVDKAYYSLYCKTKRKLPSELRKCPIGVLISPYPDLLPDVFCLMVRMFRLRVSQEECARLRESVPYVKLYRYNPKHLYPKLNGYGDNGQISLNL